MEQEYGDANQIKTNTEKREKKAERKTDFWLTLEDSWLNKCGILKFTFHFTTISFVMRTVQRQKSKRLLDSVALTLNSEDTNWT